MMKSLNFEASGARRITREASHSQFSRVDISKCSSFSSWSGGVIWEGPGVGFFFFNMMFLYEKRKCVNANR